MVVMYLTWMLVKRPTAAQVAADGTPLAPDQRPSIFRRAWSVLTYSDLVDIRTVNLQRDEHEEEPEDVADDAERETRLKGRWRWLWKLYYAVV